MIDLIVLIVLLIITYATGSYLERKHFQRITKREEALVNQPFFTDKFNSLESEVERVELVSGGCVIAADYFKNFLGGLRTLFGGSVSAYETLTERARREAILRMREQASDADMIVKARIQLTEIGRRRVEAIAYGTAVYLNKAT